MLFPSALLFGLTQLSVASASKPVKVAVIGAGAGGSSASFWLSLAKQRAAPGTDVSVTVYEKDTRVGGRESSFLSLCSSRFKISFQAAQRSIRTMTCPTLLSSSARPSSRPATET